MQFKPALLALALAGVFAGTLSRAQTNPTGGVAVHGQASFSTPAANQLVVTTQNGAGTTHSAINWQSFSIAPGSSTNFQQPSAASTVVNRVVTNTPSTIFGTLSSNGKVVLVNQSGIAVGAGAVIDTAGFTASALRMTDADALAGRMRFGDGLGSSSAISVEGRITARNGDVVLVAPNIDVGINALIQAPNGSTLLAAGQQVEITGRGLEGITMLVQAPGDQVRNLGRLQGTAVGIFAGTLHHSGEIQATTASLEGGTVVLKASADAYVLGAGKILATGTGGGHVDVLGNRVAVADQALVDVSGAHGGGMIRIGGDYQGKNAQVQNAQMTYVGAGTVLNANAVDSGTGGKVIVWADDVTRAYGNITANAGAAGGGGGFVETSGHRYLDVNGIRVTASGSATQPGSWLLDPSNLTITHAAAPGALGNMTQQQFVFGPGTQNFFTPVDSAATSTLTDANLNQFINAGSNLNVTLTTTNPSISGGSSGDITFDGASNGAIVIDRTNNANTNSNSLTLNADRNIVFASGSTTFQRSGASTGKSLTVEFNPGTSASGKVLTNSGASVVLNGVNDDLIATVKNGKVWENSGTVTLNGQSLIVLPNQTTYATFANQAGGVLDVNSSANWSFLSDSLNQAGILNNAGTINVNGTAGGSNTSWEALYQNLAGGTLNIGAGKFLSMQNGGPLAGAIAIGAGGTLKLSEQHLGGPPSFVNTAFSGAGALVVGSGVSATFGTTSGSIEQLVIEGAATVSGAVSAKDYIQVIGGSSLAGAGALNITRSFSHSAGSFAPSGNVNITQASGNLAFSDALNAGSVALAATTGDLAVSAALNGNNISLTAANALTLNADIAAAGTFTATTSGAGFATAVNHSVTAGGAMNLNLAGGLTLQSGAGNDALLQAAGNQTIAAKYVELLAAASDWAFITTTGGNQSITTSGKNAAGEGLVVKNSGTGTAVIDSGTGAQSITVTNADFVRVLGLAGHASLNSSGTQTIVLQGAGQNSLQVGNAAAADASSVNGASQTITAGQAGQLGSIQLRGGVTDGKGANIYNSGGTQTIATTGTLTLAGGTGSGVAGSPSDCGNVGACAIIDNGGVSSQNITAAAIGMQGGASGGYNIAAIQSLSGGSQAITVTGAGTSSLTGGSGSGAKNNASIYTNGAAQTISFSGAGNLQMTGGTNGSSNVAQVTSNAAASLQTVSGATSISLTGGASGGGTGTGNRAQISSNGGQNITLGSGGLSLTGGGGLLTDNSATIFQTGLSGTSQTIRLNAGGSITMVGGSSAASGVGSGHGSRALITSDSDSQLIDFTAGGAINLTGGTLGSRNWAQIGADTGTQTISGAPVITLTGGVSGGSAGEGNRANLYTSAGAQSITASSLSLQGGAAGTENRANINSNAGDQTIVANSIAIQGGAGGLENRAGISASAGNQTFSIGAGGLSLTGGSGSALELRNRANIFQTGAAGTSQTISVSGGGGITLQGGSSAGTNVGTDNGSFAFITSDGDGQLVQFSAPGSHISVTGGTVGSLNVAGFASRVGGAQTVRGTVAANNPTITLIGGASGGTATEDNSAGFSAVGAQTFNVAATTLLGGAGGIGNNAYITAPTQNLAFSGNLSLTGATGGDTNSGARIGGRGGSVSPSNTNLTLSVTGNLTLAGGTASGVAVGSTGLGTGLTNTIAITTSGDVSLSPSASQSVRIGSPSADVQTGSISVTTGGNIALNSGGGTGLAVIRSLGNVSLAATTAGKTITQASDGVIVANQLTTNSGGNTSLIGANRVNTLVASSTSGNIAFSDSRSLTVGAITTGVGAQNVDIRTVGGASDLTLGASTGDDNWTLVSGGALVLTGALGENNLSLTSGAALGLAQNLTATGTLSLITPNGSAISQSAGTIAVAGQTTINAGSAAVTLNSTSNDFNQIGVTGGLVSVRDVNAVVLGNSSVQDLLLRAGGSITMGGAVSATGAGDAIELVVGAGSGGFINPIGAGALNVTGGGRWLVYSNDPANDTRGGLAFGFKQYGTVFGGPILGSGNGFVLGLTPTLTATLTGTVSKAYDGSNIATLSAANYSVSGLPGDVLTLNNPTSGTYDSKNAGSSKTVTVNGVTLAGAQSGGAAVFGYPGNVGTLSGAVGDITPISLTLSGITASKVYDGNTSATLLTGADTFNGRVAGDNLTLASGSASFADRQAGVGKTLNVTGISLGGSDVGNYRLTGSSATSTGTITVRPVSTWTGSAGDRQWFNAGNWDALPDGANVAGVSIPAGAGSVVFGNLVSGNAITNIPGTATLQSLTSASPLTQSGGTLVSNLLTLNTQAGISLNSPGNRIGALSASNQGSGDIVVNNTGALSLIAIDNTGGNIQVTNTGAITTSGAITAPAGTVSIIANSPLTVGLGGVAAAGNVTLNAGNLLSSSAADNLTLNGPVTSGNRVILTAGNNLMQNSTVFGLNGVSATAGGSVTYGPLATTNNLPVLYTANGATVPPPPTELSTGQVVAADVIDFGQRFKDDPAGLADDPPVFNQDGSRKRKNADTVVAEGEICR